MKHKPTIIIHNAGGGEKLYQKTKTALFIGLAILSGLFFAQYDYRVIFVIPVAVGVFWFIGKRI